MCQLLVWWVNGGHQLFYFNAPKLMRDPYLQKPKVPKTITTTRGATQNFFSLLELG